MPYRPTHPYPYLNTIDVSLADGNNFRVLVNDKDIIVAYQLDIYKNSDNIKVCSIRNYSSGGQRKKEMAIGNGTYNEISLHIDDTIDTVYGGRGKDSFIVTNIPLAAGLQNGNDYKWTISLRDINGSWDDGTAIVSQEYFFIAKETAVINLNISNNATIETSNYTFAGTYSQAQNTTINYHQFDLYLNGELIDTTGEVLSSYLRYSYSKFLSGYEYEIVLTVGYSDSKVETSRKFKVSYPTSGAFLLPKINVDEKLTAINVDFNDIKSIPGKSDGYFYGFTPIYRDGITEVQGLTLYRFTKIYWDENVGIGNLNIPDDFSIIIHCCLDEGFNGLIANFEFENGLEYHIGYNGTNFYYKIGYSETVTYYPYENIVAESAVVSSDISPAPNTLYTIEEDKVINNTDYIIYNDLANQYWWKIIALPNKAIFIKSSANTIPSMIYNP